MPPGLAGGNRRTAACLAWYDGLRGDRPAAPDESLYELRGSGCLNLTAEGDDELERRALPAQIGFVVWTLAGATALGYAWRSAARATATRRTALVSLGLLAALLSAWGALVFVAPGLFRFLISVALVVVCVIVAAVAGVVGAVLGRRAADTFGGPAARLGVRPVLAFQALWMLAAILMPLLSGGSGEIEVC